jgi:hypothetical protein
MTDAEKKELEELRVKKSKYMEQKAIMDSTHDQRRQEINDEEERERQNFRDTSRDRARFAADQDRTREEQRTNHQIEEDRIEQQTDAANARNRQAIKDRQQDEEDAQSRKLKDEQSDINSVAAEREREKQRQIDNQDAGYSDKQSARQLAQARDMALISAKTGRERMKALDDYARGMELLNRKSKIAAETRESVDYAKRHEADDVAINRIQKEGENAISELESEFAILSSIRDKQLSQGGGLRSVIGENTGASEGLTDTWERIQQSAFGHVSDPAADAVLMMDRNEAVRNATMMNFYKEWFPKIANNNSGLAAD